jgi:hypothetical protein
LFFSSLLSVVVVVVVVVDVAVVVFEPYFVQLSESRFMGQFHQRAAFTSANSLVLNFYFINKSREYLPTRWGKYHVPSTS